MLVQVLGSTKVRGPAGSGGSLERKGRQLLVILALRAPEAVPLEQLIDLLWDDPPASAPKSVQAHLSRLRGALRAAGFADPVGRSGRDAYSLGLPASATDVGRVADLRARA